MDTRGLKVFIITFIVFSIAISVQALVLSERSVGQGIPLTFVAHNSDGKEPSSKSSDKYIEDKEPFIPTTEYGKLLAEFSEPRPGKSFNNKTGSYVTEEEYQILNEMKMAESERAMRENDGTKFDDAYEQWLRETGRERKA